MPDDFETNLAFGQLGESDIAKWILRNPGSSVLPAYEKEIDNGKGPRLFCAAQQLVTPDLFTFPSMTFVEAKHKTVFTWHRISKKWCTGIDIHHFEDYQRVEEVTGRPVWLMFLHRSAKPDARDIKHNCPPDCPTGLYGNSLRYLNDNINHVHGNWGRHGMVYWAVNKLTRHATLEEIDALKRAGRSTAAARSDEATVGPGHSLNPSP